MEPWYYVDTRRQAGDRLRSLLERDFPELDSPEALERAVRFTDMTVEPTRAGVDLDFVGPLLEPQPTEATAEPAPEPSPQEWVESLWRREIVCGYADLRSGEYGAALGHFESAEQLEHGRYEAVLGLYHAALSLGHLNRASLQLNRLTEVAPKHFCSNFQPEDLFDPPSAYLTQVRKLRDKVNQGQADASYVASYAYVTWFGGNRPLALKVAKDPGIRRLAPRLWRIMEATTQGQLVGAPKVRVEVEGLPGPEQPQAQTSSLDRRVP